MQLNTNGQKFINIIIGFSRDFPFTVNPGEHSEKTYPSLLELINPDDIPPITEMFTDVSQDEEKRFEAHCRFMVNDEYHWFFLSCKAVYAEYGRPVRFEGTMCDVSTYLETAGDDLVYNEFRKKHNIKLSELKKGAPRLADVLDVDYLTSIQRPFAVPQLYSAIFDEKGKLICAPKTQHKSLSPNDFAYQKKKNIRINHLISGTWILGAKTQELLDDNIQLWETLVQTVSRMANAFVVVLSEMDNSQNANKLLGQNVEEQILLNNIYAIIMQSKSADIALNSVTELIGDYFHLDRITIIDRDDFTQELCWCKDYKYRHLPLEIDGDTALDCASIRDDLSLTSSAFSDTDTNDLTKFGIKSYAIFKLINSGAFDSLIMFQTIEKEHNWTQRERKQLRNISQIISSLMMRKETQDKLEQSQKLMRQLAFYDAIYNIPNRARLNKDLDKIIKRNTKGSLIAFKVTNTRTLSAVYGHTYSDMLLRSIAQYLKDLPVKDIGVYYFTNAIFMLNLPDCTDNEAKNLVEMLIHRFSKPWKFGEDEHSIHCSLGIAFYPENGEDAEELCKAASTAMYRAREFKQNSYAFYSGSLERTRMFAASLEQHIRECINDGMRGFSLRFQPSFSAVDGSIIGCESFVRWHDEQYGNIPNSTLFPMAENLGLSHVIDGWVMERSCEFCKEIQDAGFENFTVSVNLTAGEQQSAEIVTQVRHALEESALPPSSLILEIPVKANIFYSDSTHILHDLRNLGVNIAIDKYGTGNISLKVLKNSYVNLVNLPAKLFMNHEDEFDTELVSSVIHLAKCRELTVCVKGIEDKEQLDTVQKFDIDRIQGYYCSRPLSLTEAKTVFTESIRIKGC